MDGNRIHIFGAAGSGTSTLGRVLAMALASQHFETDDFYWLPTDPPYQKKRPVPERIALMQELFLPRRDWVLSGSVDSWSASLDSRFTLAIYLSARTDVRLGRLREREERRLRVAGSTSDWEREEVEAFIDWAAGYEDGLQPGRNRMRHDSWAEQLGCPVLRFSSDGPPQAIAGDVLDHLGFGDLRRVGRFEGDPA